MRDEAGARVVDVNGQNNRGENAGLLYTREANFDVAQMQAFGGP